LNIGKLRHRIAIEQVANIQDADRLPVADIRNPFGHQYQGKKHRASADVQGEH
jgi:hypothetical protein